MPSLSRMSATGEEWQNCVTAVTGKAVTRLNPEAHGPKRQSTISHPSTFPPDFPRGAPREAGAVWVSGVNCSSERPAGLQLSLPFHFGLGLRTGGVSVGHLALQILRIDGYGGSSKGGAQSEVWDRYGTSRLFGFITE